MRHRTDNALRLEAEHHAVAAFIAAGLEAGLSWSDAVALAIGLYRDIDVLARTEEADLLSPRILADIRAYSIAILRSGSTFASFEIANRAVAAWRQSRIELRRLHRQWDRESVTRRLKTKAARAARHAPAPDYFDSSDGDGGVVDEIANAAGGMEAE